MSFQSDFINKYSDDVIKATSGTELFPSVKMAQMILESGWGKSYNAIKANNFFGIKKGTGWTGAVITLNTPNDANKKSVFRKYDSPLESIKDHTNFLLLNPRYKKNGVFSALTPQEQIKAISNSGYAESSFYTDSILQLIKKYDLKKLDYKQKVNPFLTWYSPLVFFFSYFLF
jgi:peptidoglycan endopeptidase LytF